MKVRRTAVCLALALALGAPNVFAQAGGLPAEAAARQAADAELGARIDAEAVARMAADQQLHDGINETSVVGRYAMTGSQSCLSPSTGFNPDFSIRFLPGVTTTVTSNSIYVHGVFIFQADGHGSSDTLATVVNTPAGFNTPSNTGGVSVQHLTGTFDWTLEDGKLTLFNQTAPSVQVQGPGTGSTGIILNVQPLVGSVGKDAKVITLSNDGLGIETVQRFVNGQTFSSDRICGRQRVLTKLAD
jgi:hypothetical protein